MAIFKPLGQLCVSVGLQYTVEEVGMSLTDTSRSRLTNQVLQDMNA